MFRLWYRFDLSHKFTAIQASVQEKLSNCVFKKQLESKFGETTCYSQSCVLSRALRSEPEDWWSSSHMKHIIPLMIFVGTVGSKPHSCSGEMRSWFNIKKKLKKKTNKVSLCQPVEESVQTAVACQLGTQSVIGHPAAFWKCTGITKSICVWRWEIGIGKCSLLHPPLLAWDGRWAVEHLWTRMV